MRKRPHVVTFGEIMLRLDAPGKERLFQKPNLLTSFAGGEANVAVALSAFGSTARFVTLIPENPIGNACMAELKKHGVDTTSIVRTGGRLGLYFVETGSNQRPSRVTYDRDRSALAEIGSSDIEWHRTLYGVDWFHVSGITPAISAAAAEQTSAAVRTAKSLGVKVSCDLNYRAKLWRYGASPKEIMGRIVAESDVLIGNEEDCQQSLGIAASVDVESGDLDVAKYQELTEKVMEHYPNLERVALTIRRSISADHNEWFGVMRTFGGFFESRQYQIRNIVDRIGAGDAFAGGLIHSLVCGRDDQEVLEFAVGASCIKHSIPGDFVRFSEEEVDQLISGPGTGRVVR